MRCGLVCSATATFCAGLLPPFERCTCAPGRRHGQCTAGPQPPHQDPSVSRTKGFAILHSREATDTCDQAHDNSVVHHAQTAWRRRQGPLPQPLSKRASAVRRASIVGGECVVSVGDLPLLPAADLMTGVCLRPAGTTQDPSVSRTKGLAVLRSSEGHGRP